MLVCLHYDQLIVIRYAQGSIYLNLVQTRFSYFEFYTSIYHIYQKFGVKICLLDETGREILVIFQTQYYFGYFKQLPQ